MERFESILFDRSGPHVDVDGAAEPGFFGDLNLDQVVAALTVDYEEYDLVPFLRAPLHNADAVSYRHEVLRDLENDAVREPVEEFAHRLRRVRAYGAQARQLRYAYQQQRWFLDVADVCCDAVSYLRDQLSRVRLGSRGMEAFREYLGAYVESDPFRALAADTRSVREGLAQIRYRVHIRGSAVTVSYCGSEADYSVDVEETFAKFKQGAVKDYRVRLPDVADMNHVEAQILDGVARLYPDRFQALDRYCTRHRDHLDATIARFDREVQLYLCYLRMVRRLSEAGLAFCYPDVSDRSHEVGADDAFDLALALKLVADKTPVVCNSFSLRGKERVVVVTGPNQGGKTTFARMFGQLHHLAGLGLPVPGTRARLFLPDQIFSHFEREESLATLQGKLDDELARIHDILTRATSNSVIVMNESFSSTTLNDARYIGTEVLGRIIRLGSLNVYVTFIDQLASLDEAIVSMVGAIVPDDPTKRTYEIVRRPADGLAYATAIATKYGLTYDTLRRRIAR